MRLAWAQRSRGFFPSKSPLHFSHRSGGCNKKVKKNLVQFTTLRKLICKKIPEIVPDTVWRKGFHKIQNNLGTLSTVVKPLPRFLEEGQ